MKRSIVAASAILFLSIFATAQQKPVITVLDFKTSGVSEQEMKAIISLISNTLFKTGKFTVIDITQREALLKEIEFSLSGCVEESCQIEIGKQLSAEMIVVGRIDKVGTNLILASKVVETETAKTIKVADGVYRDLDELVRNIRIFGGELAGLPPPTDASKKESPSTPISVETKHQAAPPEFALVKAGTFWMGSTNGYKDQQPVHKVTISRSFYMGKYEVTQKQWRNVMGINPSVFKSDDLPVESITWYEAAEYCNRLSQLDGLKPCYSGNNKNITCNFFATGYRLPTEAEWEYAARGGSLSRGTTYSGSNSANAVGWYVPESDMKTQPVGQKAPNELGLFDLSGNVWEWCWDRYEKYNSVPTIDPRGGEISITRVSRGGSCMTYAEGLQWNVRYYQSPDAKANDLGFRLVRTAE